MIYQWRAGLSFPVKAEAVVPRLVALRKRKGSLAPSDVVDDARAKTSPLHECFEWNNSTAAEQWRLLQARNLIGALVMVPDDGDENTEPVRCFVSVNRNSEDSDESDYTPLNVLMREMASDPETRQQMLLRAIRAAQTLKRQYGHLLPELSEMFEVIARLEQGATV